MSYFILAMVKIFDNIISTAKTITSYREQKILSSVLTIISQLIFYLVVSKVISDNTIEVILLVSVAAGIGNLLAFFLNDYFKKDSKWTMVLTSSDKEDVEKLSLYLTKHNIKHIANYGIDREGNNTFHIIAFSKTKNESKLIEMYLTVTESEYLKEII